MRHQEGRHSYLGGQAFRKEDTPRDLLSLKDSPIRRKKDIPKDLLILKDSPIRRKKDIPRDLIILKDETPRKKVFLSWRTRLQEGRHSQGLTYPEGRESKKEDIPNLEDKTSRKEDIPRDLLILKDEAPRRRTCLSWRTRHRKEDIPGVSLILIRYENPRAQQVKKDV